MRRHLLAAAALLLATPAYAQVTAPPPRQDVFNVKAAPFNAKCDGVSDDHTKLQRALDAAVALLNVGHTAAGLYIPPGTCVSSTALTATIPYGASLLVYGDGSGIAALQFTGTTNGLSIVGTATPNTTTLGSGFNVHGLSFVQAGTGIANTGLSVRTNAAANGGVTNGQRISDVVFRGAARATQGWLTGLYAEGFQSLHITDLAAFLPDGHGKNIGGTGISMVGVDTNHYATDAHIENITIQGGHAGIAISGAVQGVYITNPAIIGLDYGIYWNAAIGDGAEDLKVTGGHINAHWRGIYMNNMSEPIVTGVLFLRFNPAGTDTDSPPAGPTWTAIDSYNTNNVAYNTNIIYGCGCATNGTTENGMTISSTNVTGAQPGVVNGNSIAAINNVGVALVGTVVNMTVSGNSFNGVLGGPYNITNPAAWAINTVYAANSAVLANGNAYTTVAGGTSAATGGGPATTTPTNPDGSVTWQYVGPNPAFNVNATFGNSSNGQAEMNSDGVGNFRVNTTNFFTNALQPLGQRTKPLGSASAVWSQVWAGQFVLNNGAISATLGSDNGGNVTMGTAPSFMVNPGVLYVGSTRHTDSGCSATTPLGIGTVGSFVSGTTGTCTVAITLNGATGTSTATGWFCQGTDITHSAEMLMTGSTATTCTISGTTTSGDEVRFFAHPFK